MAKLAFFFLRDMEEMGAEVCFQSNFSEINSDSFAKEGKRLAFFGPLTLIIGLISM
jgi:hypothetical protein